MKLLVTKGIIPTTLGSIAYLFCDGRSGGGPQNPTEAPAAASVGVNKLPILCFHSSPRSSDEYLEVLPLLAVSGRPVIAIDTPGYGSSENPSRSCSIDDLADGFVEVANALLGNDATFATVGNLMGCFMCVSLASRYPNRVKACILANLYYFPPKDGSEQDKAQGLRYSEGEEIPDSFVLEDDGSHLVSLHDKRKKWLDPELNFRVVHSEVSYLVNRRARYAKGIRIQDVSDYDFAAPAQKTECPTLCVSGQACLQFFDMIGYKGTHQFEAGCKLLAAKDCPVKALEGNKSTLNLINQIPEEFASACSDFLSERGL